MATKKAVAQEVKTFRCCGAHKTPENTTNAGKCRRCRDARAAQWREEHPDRAREISRKSESKRYVEGKVDVYRIKNRDRINERQREYYHSEKDAPTAEEKAERHRAASRRYYQRSRDQILARQALRRAEKKAAAHNASL